MYSVNKHHNRFYQQCLLVNNDSPRNRFSSNKIVSSTPQGLKIEQDGMSKINVFSSSQIVRAVAGISGLVK